MGTKKHVGVALIAVALIGAVILSTAPVTAQSYDPTEDIPRETGLQKALTKLGRGLSNIMLGWAEIPVAMDRSIKQGKPFGHLIGVAPVMGTARALMRTSTGVFEVFSFPFTDRNVNYEAVLEPEFIF